MQLENFPTESCTECGACCFGDGPRYLRVSGDDHRRVGADSAALTRFIGNRCYMRLLDTHCAALSLATDRTDFVCRIYETRPDECRRMERGSDACLAERSRKRARARRAPRDLLPAA